MLRLDRQLVGLTLLSLALSLVLLIFGTRYTQASGDGPAASAVTQEVLTPEKYRRLPDQTYLTFPEWFLVFSPREYAIFVKTKMPTEFPFLGHLAQFWTGYAQATKAAREYPFNFDYHLMNCIIGASTTVEFLVKASYEATVGRLSGLLADGQLTDEDYFSANMSEDYCRLLETKAWYDYPYFATLKVLWTQVPWFGPGMLRKWERRYFFTTEYTFKGAYAYLMLQAARSAYDPEVPTTAVIDSNGKLLQLPRYQAFQKAAAELAKQGTEFREIAGNQDSIMLSFLTKDGQSLALAGTTLLFTQPILTDTSQQRIVLKVPIRRLHEVLLQGVPEHVFDY